MKRYLHLYLLMISLFCCAGCHGQGNKSETVNKELIPFRSRQNGKVGYTDTAGNIVVSAKYFSGTYQIEEAKGFYIVGKDETNVGLINTSGDFVIDPIYQTIAVINTDMALVVKDDKWGYVNLSGKVIIPIEYEQAGSELYGGLLKAKKGGKWGFINPKGTIVIPFKYDDADDFYDGFASVQLNKKFSYITTAGKEMFPFVYEDAKRFADGLAPVKYKGKWGYITSAGKVVIPFEYDSADYFSNGEGSTYSEKTKKFYFFDKTGKLIKTSNDPFGAKED
jgi:hypothetical protein